LERVLGYLQGTVERMLVLHYLDSNMHMCAYLDASYALHQDSKSHTGVVMYVGKYVGICVITQTEVYD
jgi:hypothetical protein